LLLAAGEFATLIAYYGFVVLRLGQDEIMSKSLARGFFRRSRWMIREKENSLASFLERERRDETSSNLRRSHARQLFDPHPPLSTSSQCSRWCSQ
jgi:hypothetical protein